jgi:hypothetical protein
MAKQIMIPDERAAQLKQIAKDHGVKVPDAIGLLIEWAVEAGKIKDEIPSIKIFRDGQEINVDLGDWKKSFSLFDAAAFASELRKLTQPTIEALKADIQTPPKELLASISRHGPGVKIVDTETGAQKTLAKSIAGDIARMVETAAKKD